MRPSAPNTQDPSSVGPTHPAHPSPPAPRPISQPKKAFAATSMWTLAKPSTHAAPQVEPPPHHGPQLQTTEEHEMDFFTWKETL